MSVADHSATDDLTSQCDPAYGADLNRNGIPEFGTIAHPGAATSTPGPLDEGLDVCPSVGRRDSEQLRGPRTGGGPVTSQDSGVSAALGRARLVPVVVLDDAASAGPLADARVAGGLPSPMSPPAPRPPVTPSGRSPTGGICSWAPAPS